MFCTITETKCNALSRFFCYNDRMETLHGNTEVHDKNQENSTQLDLTVQDEDEIEKEELSSEPFADTEIEYKIFTREFYKNRHKTEPSKDRFPVETDEFLRARYVNKVETLIQEIVNGNIETLFFLDKSARPLAWMVKELWDVFAPKTPIPTIKFMNFDAQSWRGQYPELVKEDNVAFKNRDINISVIPEKEIAKLHDTFTYGAGLARRGQTGTQIRQQDQIGEKILVIDEISLSGTTRELAASFLQRAFPKTEVSSTSVFVIGRAEEEQPIWYSPKYANMRGVGELSKDSAFLSRPGLTVVNKDFDPMSYLRHRRAQGDLSLTIEQIQAELAIARQEMKAEMEAQDIHSEKNYYEMLTAGSTAPPSAMRIPDQTSLQLRAEIRKLGADVRSGKQPIFDGFMSDANGNRTEQVLYRYI